jgi:uncharacterized protein
MKFHLKLFWIAIFLLAAVQALEVPRLTGHINDTAGLLTSGQKQVLENILTQHEQQTSHQFILLTIPSLEGENLESYSIRVAEKWKIGRKNLDNGLIMLIARDDHEIRIEVGYGLESVITDAFAGDIIREIIVPAFKAGDFNTGIENAFKKLIDRSLGLEVELPAASSGSGVPKDIEDKFVMLLFFTVFFGIVTKLIPFFWMKGIAGMIALPFMILIFGFKVSLVMFGILILLGWPYAILAWILAEIFLSSGKAGFRSGGGGGGWSSSGGGGFSGGGGSFGGGGSSGKW